MKRERWPSWDSSSAHFFEMILREAKPTVARWQRAVISVRGVVSAEGTIVGCRPARAGGDVHGCRQLLRWPSWGSSSAHLFLMCRSEAGDRSLATIGDFRSGSGVRVRNNQLLPTGEGGRGRTRVSLTLISGSTWSWWSLALCTVRDERRALCQAIWRCFG